MWNKWQILKYQKTLKTHKATSHKEQHGEIDHNKTIPCDQCDKKFDLELKLKKHKQVDHKTCKIHFQVKHEFKTRTNLFKPEALEILDSSEDGEDFLSMAGLDNN